MRRTSPTWPAPSSRAGESHAENSLTSPESVLSGLVTFGAEAVSEWNRLVTPEGVDGRGLRVLRVAVGELGAGGVVGVQLAQVGRRLLQVVVQAAHADDQLRQRREGQPLRQFHPAGQFRWLQL